MATMVNGILPVLDFRCGTVVHAVAGRRDDYVAIRSKLSPSAVPIDVAHAFRNQFGLTELYVADLDAIGGGEPDQHTIDQLVDAGFALWLDAGPQSIAGNGAHRLILATEWLAGAADLNRAVEWHGCERIALGVDLRNGQTRTQVPEWQERDAVGIVGQAVQLGIRSIVVLDVSDVGTNQGPSVAALAVCRQLKTEFPKIELVSGGGVRDVADVTRFHAAGADQVLVATALHNGQIPRVAVA